jgi:hypothetical protein
LDGEARNAHSILVEKQLQETSRERESYESYKTLGGQNAELFIFNAGGTYSYHWTVKG